MSQDTNKSNLISKLPYQALLKNTQKFTSYFFVDVDLDSIAIIRLVKILTRNRFSGFNAIWLHAPRLVKRLLIVLINVIRFEKPVLHLLDNEG